MSKTLLKANIAKRQNGHSQIESIPLPKENELWDTDRINPKSLGGIYTDENTRGLLPVEHMKRHGIYRDREDQLHELKKMIDGREQVRKFVNSCNNRLLAMRRRTDDLDIDTESWLKEQTKNGQSELTKIDRKITKHLKSMDYPVIKSALGVRGLGPITVAYMMVYIDIKKAEYVSCLWSYVGIVKPSHERYTKGEAGGGNKNLRTILYTMADSMIKTRSVYRDVYDMEKMKLSLSERKVMTRNTQGKLIESMWKETKPSHRHGAAIRKMIKHFLSDWWFVHRITEGMTVSAPYVIEHLGHKDYIMPENRGWNY
jgi:hypothetical protein